MTTRRLVFADAVDRDAVDDAMSTCGHVLSNVFAANETRPAQLLFLSADRRTLFHVIDDRRIGVRYVVVTGGDVDASCRTFVTALGPSATTPPGSADVAPAIVDPATLLVALGERDDPAAVVRALCIAALALDGPHERALDAFRWVLSHQDEGVRAAALVAAAYARWPALRPFVSACTNDPSAAVRAHAAALLAALPGHDEVRT